MASANALFRRLRRVADAYIDQLNLGELEQLTEHLRRIVRDSSRGGYQPLPSGTPMKAPPKSL